MSGRGDLRQDGNATSPSEAWASASGVRESHRLLRYDRMIIANELRAAVSTWHDRLIAVVVILIAFAALRSAVPDRPLAILAPLASAAAFLIGFGTETLIRRRLEFHASDGILVIDATRSRQSRRYRASWHLIALVSLCAVVLLVRTELLPFSLLAYSVGAAIAHIAIRVLNRRHSHVGWRADRAIGSYLQRPMAGLVVALIALSFLLPARAFESEGQVATAAVLTVLAALGLTSLDDAVIRFMTFSGHGGWSIMAFHARRISVFLGIMVPACLMAFPPLVAAALAGAGIAGLALMCLRVLAYRLHSKPMADTIVTICVGAIAITAMAAPMLLPVVAMIIPWQLHRRSAAKTWLLA